MTILLRTVLMRGHHRRRTKGSGTMRADRHQTRLTGRTTGLHRRIKGGPTITRRRHRHRRIETEIMIETATVIAITIATGMGNRVITCTLLLELL
jgi:hypothetical protein